MTQDIDFAIPKDSECAELEVSTYELQELRKRLSNTDMGNVLLLAIKAKSILNLLCEGNFPYTSAELQKYLKLKSQSNFIALIKRLIAANVLCKVKINRFGKIGVGYVFNPMIARTQSSFDNDIIKAFKYATKDESGNITYTPNLTNIAITLSK